MPHGVRSDTSRASDHTARSRIWLIRALCVCGFMLALSGLSIAGPLLGEPKSNSRRLPDDRIRLGDPATSNFDRIAEVRVVGNASIPSKTILTKIKTREQRKRDERQIRLDLSALLETGWFRSVDAYYIRSEEGLIVVFDVLEKPIVQKVEFKGNKVIKTRDLVELTGLKPGSAFDINVNREACRRIETKLQEKGYLYAQCKLLEGNKRSDRNVVFEVNDGPYVYVKRVSFSGNKEINSAILRLKLKTSARIIPYIGGKFDGTTIPEDKEAIRRYYHELGYFDIQIAHEEKFLSKDRAQIEVAYTISEGPRYKIRDMIFEGNDVLSEETLRKDLKIKVGEFFNQRSLAADIEKIQNQYNELGRVFAQVEPRSDFSNVPGVVDIVWTINEDRPYVLRRINVNIRNPGGVPHTKQSVVLDPMMVRPGDLAHNGKFRRSIDRVIARQVFAGNNRNAPDAPTFNVTKGQDLEQPNPFANAGGSTVRGQSRAEPAAGKKQKSRPFTEAMQSGMFDGVSPVFRGQNAGGMSGALLAPQRGVPMGPSGVAQPAPYVRGANPYVPGANPFDPFADPVGQPFVSPPGPGFVDLNITANETTTGRLMAGVGVNSNAGLLGNITLEENNFDIFRFPRSVQEIMEGSAFRGAGQQFRMEAMPGTLFSRYAVSWRDPYFLNTDFNLALSASYYQRFFPNWFEQRAGGRVAVGRVFTPNNITDPVFSTGLAIRMEEVRISDASIPTPREVTDVLGSNFVSTARTNFVYDTRDMPFMAGSGTYLEFAYEQGLGNFFFPRAELEAKKFFTVWQRPDGANRHILSFTSRLGYTGSQTPFFERFFAGGFTDLRGFAFYGVTPRENGFRVGGNFLFTGSAEYMLPVTASDNLQLVAFTDFGTVDRTARFDNMRLSVGGGVRFTVPAMSAMPIALDWGIPLLQDDQDNRQLFQFYIQAMR